MADAPYAVMWSGGKDSALALRRSLAAGLNVRMFVSIFDPSSGRIRFHGTRRLLIQAQAAALGLELRELDAAWTDFDQVLSTALSRLRDDGFAGVVFGDIHLADVRAWYQERVEAAGLSHVEPLWGEAPARLLREFVGGGGRAVVTCVELARLDLSWLGRITDPGFCADIMNAGVDPCGENGEFHTFAYAGPPFPAPLAWTPGERRLEDRFAQLDLLPVGRPGATGAPEQRTLRGMSGAGGGGRGYRDASSPAPPWSLSSSVFGLTKAV